MMKRPTISAYLFGNSISLLLSYAVTAFLIYQAFIGGAHWVAVIIAAGVPSYCTTSSDRVEAYRLWKLEWDAMSGVVRRPSLFVRAPWLNVVLGYGIWLAVMWITMKVVPDQRTAIAAWFWIGNALLVAFGLFKLLRRKRRAPTTKLVQVTLCLRVPQQSPHVRQTYSALPEYCKNLLIK